VCRSRGAGAPPPSSFGGLIRNEIEKSEKLIGEEIKEENVRQGKVFSFVFFWAVFFSIDC
jgi:hypothetical protein